MWGLAYQAVYRFFVTLTVRLNKGEKDQPAPLEVQLEHLKRELKNVEALIDARKKHDAQLR